MRLTAQQKIEIAEAIERIAFLPAQPARDLPKVRNALGLLRSLLTRYASQIDYAKERMGIASAALAELDASAQPWRDLPNVRAYLNKRRIDNGEDMVSPGFEASINKDVRMLRAALAELDAQPKAVEVPVREIARASSALRLWKTATNAEVFGAIEDADSIDRWLAAVEGEK